MIVARAAEEAATREELLATLAQHLRRPEDAAQCRRRMLAAVGARKSPPPAGF